MKKTLLKKLIVLVALIAILATSLVGCSVIEYNDEKDLGQVVIELKESEVTVKVPYMMDYVDPNGNKVYEVDEDRTSATFGATTTKVVQVVKYDHNGNPIFKPKKDGNSVVYVKYNEEGDKAEIGETTNLAEASFSETSDNYWINPEDGNEYMFLNIANNGKAQWKSLHEVNKYVYGAAQPKGEAVVAGDVSFLPTITYVPSDHTLYTFKQYTYVPETTIYTTSADRFFKQELMAQFSQKGKEYLAEGNVDINAVFDRIVKEMYSDLISKREIEIAIAEGKINYGVTEKNAVKKAIYTSIDSNLNTIYNKIAEKHDRSIPSATNGSVTQESSEKDSRYLKDYKVWDISQEPERWPNNDTNVNRNSLERAGVREFLQNIKDSIKNTYSMTEEQRKLFNDEISELQEEAKEDSKIVDIYKKLYTYDVIKFMFGSSVESSKKAALLHDYIGKDVVASTADINEYKKLLADQQSSYAKIDNYYTATSDNASKILYFANDDVFWVKHILLPFTDDDQAKLTEYKKNHSDKEVEDYRQQLVNSMTVFKQNGDEESKGMTLSQAYGNIKAVMDSTYGNEYDALRAFDVLIETYNTDPGIKDNEMGYAVTYKSAEAGGRDETYMIEFARESRELVNAYKKGMSLYDYKLERESSSDGAYVMSDFERSYISSLKNTVKIGSISQPVATDYGVHILMLNFVPSAKYVRSVNEYLTAAKYTKVCEAIYEDNTSTAKSNRVSSWKNAITNSYASKVMYDTLGNVNGEGVIIAVYKSKFQANLDDYEKSFTSQIAAEKKQEEEEKKENS